LSPTSETKISSALYFISKQAELVEVLSETVESHEGVTSDTAALLEPSLVAPSFEPVGSDLL
jgi:hypothetical protein